MAEPRNIRNETNVPVNTLDSNNTLKKKKEREKEKKRER